MTSCNGSRVTFWVGGGGGSEGQRGHLPPPPPPPNRNTKLYIVNSLYIRKAKSTRIDLKTFFFFFFFNLLGEHTPRQHSPSPKKACIVPNQHLILIHKAKNAPKLISEYALFFFKISWGNMPPDPLVCRVPIQISPAPLLPQNFLIDIFAFPNFLNATLGSVCHSQSNGCSFSG